ncbi:hypothetical protein H9P43_008474 [Blastocladiella emersonii ATCC 22665]|nr:hypothetical protein H9P43_008474 [Blastocladiella emersonii ATCC 22665]
MPARFIDSVAILSSALGLPATTTVSPTLSQLPIGSRTRRPSSRISALLRAFLELVLAHSLERRSLLWSLASTMFAPSDILRDSRASDSAPSLWVSAERADGSVRRLPLQLRFVPDDDDKEMPKHLRPLTPTDECDDSGYDCADSAAARSLETAPASPERTLHPTPYDPVAFSLFNMGDAVPRSRRGACLPSDDDLLLPPPPAPAAPRLRVMTIPEDVCGSVPASAATSPALLPHHLSEIPAAPLLELSPAMTCPPSAAMMGVAAVCGPQTMTAPPSPYHLVHLRSAAATRPSSPTAAGNGFGLVDLSSAVPVEYHQFPCTALAPAAVPVTPTASPPPTPKLAAFTLPEPASPPLVCHAPNLIGMPRFDLDALVLPPPVAGTGAASASSSFLFASRGGASASSTWA